MNSGNHLIEIEQSGYVTAALRHLHAAQTAAADESRVTAKQLSAQQQVFVAFNIVILVQFVIKYMTYVFLDAIASLEVGYECNSSFIIGNTVLYTTQATIL